MQTGPDVLRATDWTRTFHAYGSAADAPEHLALLLTGDTGERERALSYLYSAVLHQGTVYPATVPVALFVAGILDRPEPGDPARDSAADTAGAAPAPLRQTLPRFLTEAAESTLRWIPDGGPGPALPEEAELDRVYAALASDGEEAIRVWEEPAVTALMDRACFDMRAAAPVLHEAVRPLLTHADALTRIRAVEAVSALTRLGGLDLDLSGAADMAESRDEGAVIVLALGRAGGDTAEFLAHADPAIRACAALAPSQRENPAATGELVAALADPAEADAWFTTRPAFFTGHVHSALVRTLAERSGPRDAERLLPVLGALASLASPADADTYPLLALAFPPGNGARGPDARSAPAGAQRAYLRLLLDTEGFWDGEATGFRRCLALLGLPPEREGIRALLEG